MQKVINIIFFIFLSSCLTFSSSAKANEKIKIGLLVPMTGSNKELGQSIIKAVRLAVKDIDSDFDFARKGETVRVSDTGRGHNCF